MRLLHTADWHLGHELYGFDRRAEHEAFFDWLLERVAETKPDAVLVAGDVFHHVNPSIDSQRLYYDVLRRLGASSARPQLVVIGGNHDSAQRLELPDALQPSQRRRLVGAAPRSAGRPDWAAMAVPLTRADGAVGAVCAAVPYLRPGDGFGAGDGGSAQENLAAFYASARDAACAAAPGAPVVLMGHLHITGGAVSELSERRILVGGEEAAPPSIFPQDAAYVALGHLHKPQEMRAAAAGPVIRYAGSPFPLSASERDYDHGVSLVALETGGAASVEHVRFPRPVAFLRAPARGAATLETLPAALAALAPPPASPCGPAILEVALTLETATPDLRPRVEEALDAVFGPGAVRLGRIVRAGAADTPDEIAGAWGGAADAPSLDALTPDAVFETRHRVLYDGPPPEALSRAFAELLAGLAPERPGGSAGAG